MITPHALFILFGMFLTYCAVPLSLLCLAVCAVLYSMVDNKQMIFVFVLYCKLLLFEVLYCWA